MLAHEKLIVYQRSIELVAWVGPVIKEGEGESL